jgi:hypothetical protein
VRVIASDEQSLCIVLETDLARLKAQLVAWWGNAEAQVARVTPYVPVVIAAEEYAASWRTWEMKPYLDLDGLPIDAVRGARYLGPHWTELYVQAVAALAQRDAYAALVASLHWEALLEQVRDAWPPELELAIADQALLREHLVEALWEEGAYRLEADTAHLADNVSVLNAVDSLATWLVGPTRDASEVQAGGIDVRVRQDDAEHVTVSPFPFERDPLEVTWTLRTVPNRPYGSHLEFLESFYRAPRLHRRCLLRS